MDLFAQVEALPDKDAIEAMDVPILHVLRARVLSIQAKLQAEHRKAWKEAEVWRLKRHLDRLRKFRISRRTRLWFLSRISAYPRPTMANPADQAARCREALETIETKLVWIEATIRSKDKAPISRSRKLRRYDEPWENT